MWTGGLGCMCYLTAHAFLLHGSDVSRPKIVGRQNQRKRAFLYVPHFLGRQKSKGLRCGDGKDFKDAVTRGGSMPRMTGPQTVVRTFGHSTRSNRHRTHIRYEPPRLTSPLEFFGGATPAQLSYAAGGSNKHEPGRPYSCPMHICSPCRFIL